jgi:FkbM family methyltransferase
VDAIELQCDQAIPPGACEAFPAYHATFCDIPYITGANLAAYYSWLPAFVDALPHEPTAWVLDIGVNVGIFSIASAARGFRTLGFEPVPANLVQMSMSFCRNPNLLDLMTVVPAAVGDATNTTPGVTIYALEGREDNTAMSQSTTTANIAGKVTGLIVPIVTIDDYIASNDAFAPKDCVWMKIDVQGYESHGKASSWASRCGSCV